MRHRWHGFVIVVTKHAEMRGRARFGWKPAQVRERVGQAIIAGRLSAQRPAWLEGAAHAYTLYAWTEDLSATFAVAGCSTHWEVLTVMGEIAVTTPGRDYESSYKGFVEMPESEWLGLIGSLFRGGVLEWPEEQRAFEDAMRERARRRQAEDG